MANFIKLLRTRELGLNSNVYASKPNDTINNVVAKPLIMTNDKELVNKIYIKVIDMEDCEGERISFLCWMSNTVIGGIIEISKDMDKDEVIMKMFIEAGYQMYMCFDNIVLGRIGHGVFSKPEIVRNVVITVEQQDKDIFLHFYQSMKKPANLFFNIISAEQSSYNIINQVIATYKRYCAIDDKLTKVKMIDHWLNFYIIPSIVFDAVLLDKTLIDKIKRECK